MSQGAEVFGLLFGAVLIVMAGVLVWGAVHEWRRRRPKR
jgi:hypothetical protein